MNRGFIPDYITGLPVEIFALAIWERKPALGVSQKHVKDGKRQRAYFETKESARAFADARQTAQRSIRTFSPRTD